MNTTMRIIYFILISAVFLSCNERIKTTNTNPTDIIYILDTTWNKTSNSYVFNQPTGIGINKFDHVFVFQRTGRKWTTPFPDSLISQNTVLELDSETGKLINSWDQTIL